MKNINHLFESQKKFFYNNLINEKINYQLKKLKLIREWIKKNEKRNN